MNEKEIIKKRTEVYNKRKIIVDPEKIQKILIIQFGPFGDVFLTSSIFECIKKQYPKATLSYLVRSPYQITVQNHPFLDDIITFPKKKGLQYLIERFKLFKLIRDKKFDLVIDQQCNPGSQQVTLFSGAKYRVGYHFGQFAFVYNLKASVHKERYTPSKRFDLLSPLGISEKPWKFYYEIQQKSYDTIKEWLNKVSLNNKKFIVLSPGSPVKRKIWNLDNYAKLGDMIKNLLHLEIVLLWAPNEFDYAQYVADKMKEPCLLAPKTSINESLALLKSCEMLICNDGGLNHFSVASETKTLALFGCTHPLVWSPASVFPTHHHLFKYEDSLASDNTFGITPNEVLLTVKKILKL